MKNIINYDNLFNFFKHWDEHTDCYLGIMFINVYKELPVCYYIKYNNSNNLVIDRFLNKRNTKDEEDIVCDDYTYDTFMVDDRALLDNFIYNSDKFEIINYTPSEYLVLGKLFPFLTIITTSECEKSLSAFHTIYVANNDTQNNIVDCVKQYYVSNKRAKESEFGIAAVDPGGSLYTTYYDFNHIDIDINKNYNDDIPYDRMIDILNNKDKSSLLLFYGEPGTGKSTMIKHFIEVLPNKDFVFVDGSLLANIQQDRLMSYFLENKDTIFIFEDCERILLNRDHNYNPTMPILLNLTDGIVADVLNIKIICTFNTPLNNIDKALLRKGRLTLKYEFKKLNKEKVKVLLEDNTINTDMTLADIYNYKEENDYSKKQQNKVGFV